MNKFQSVLPQSNTTLPIESLSLACIRCVSQCQQILAAIPESVFCENSVGTSSVGAHTRHIIERFSCFIPAYADGQINYDQRKRDQSLELDLNNANKALQAITEDLSLLREVVDSSLSVSESVDEHSDVVTVDSTIERELMGLVSHTIHHLAIIAMLVKAQGYTLNADLGKAPSTIIYEKKCQGIAD